QLEEVSVLECENPRRFRMVRKDESGEYAEAFFRVHGVVAAKELPPLKLPQEASRRNRAMKFSVQSIRLRGFGVPKFDQSVYTLEQVFLRYCQHFDDGTVQQWSPSSSGQDEWSIEASTRYFTRNIHAGNEKAVPFAPKVDPMGELAAMGGDDWIHTADNEVNYLMRTIDPTNGKPHTGRKVKMAVTLKAVTLVDPSMRNKAAILRMRSRYTLGGASGTIPLKRKAAYEIQGDDGTLDAQRKMARMSVDE
ncbi:hypothetical protein FA13DRAFT_1639649, partial [Coprinellus micaceus]